VNEKQRRRSVEIDILRFFSACMVATYHWTLEMNSESAQQILDIPILGAVISQGGIGVEIFLSLAVT
jgi:peptidoglycan/LPS O-acetylase OafA/YrhL